jgi:hypothetical protein
MKHIAEVQGVLGQKIAKSNANADVRNAAHLGAAGAHAWEGGRTEHRPDASRPTWWDLQ